MNSQSPHEVGPSGRQRLSLAKLLSTYPGPLLLNWRSTPDQHLQIQNVLHLPSQQASDVGTISSVTHAACGSEATALRLKDLLIAYVCYVPCSAGLRSTFR